MIGDYTTSMMIGGFIGALLFLVWWFLSRSRRVPTPSTPLARRVAAPPPQLPPMPYPVPPPIRRPVHRPPAEVRV